MTEQPRPEISEEEMAQQVALSEEIIRELEEEERAMDRLAAFAHGAGGLLDRNDAAALLRLVHSLERRVATMRDPS